MDRAVPALAVALLASLTASCTDPPLATCDDPECEVEISLMADTYPNENVALGEATSLPYVYGGQGGSMIRPYVVFAPGAVPVGQELRVRVAHHPDPAAPEAYGVVADFPGFDFRTRVVERDGELVVGPFNDQIGWGDPTGVRFVLDVHIEGSVAAHASSAITILSADAEPDPYPQCADFELTGADCQYRSVPPTS